MRTSEILWDVRLKVLNSPKPGPRCTRADVRACERLAGERCKAAVLLGLDEDIAWFEMQEAQDAERSGRGWICQPDGTWR